jgi:hypothetical protein
MDTKETFSNQEELVNFDRNIKLSLTEKEIHENNVLSHLGSSIIYGMDAKDPTKHVEVCEEMDKQWKNYLEMVCDNHIPDGSGKEILVLFNSKMSLMRQILYYYGVRYSEED